MLNRIIYFRLNVFTYLKYLVVLKYYKKIIQNTPSYSYDKKALSQYVNYMFANNSWFRSRYSDLKELKLDLRDFNINNKADLRKFRAEELVTSGLKEGEYTKNSTSGSTGEPFVFYSYNRSKESSEYTLAALYDMWDKKIKRGKLLSIWSHVGNRLNYPWYMNLYKRQFTYDVGELSRKSVVDIANAVQKNGIEIIRAYPSTLMYICEIISERTNDNLESCFESLRLVQIGGEKLWDYQAELIEKVLGVKVIDMYGAREASLILGKFPNKIGFYPLRRDIIIEVVDEQGNEIIDGEGDILLTDLGNRAYPIIRYSTGDRAIISMGIIQDIIGRSFEVLEFKEGLAVGASFWTWLMRSDSAIKAFQIIQLSQECVQIDVVNEGVVGTEILEATIRKSCGDIEILWNYVNEISRERESGKILLVKRMIRE